MENMTEITKKMYDSAQRVRSVAQAAEVLHQNGQFRTLGDILRACTRSENPKTMLVDGLFAANPAASRDSMDKKVRNWLSGRTRTVSKQDAFVLSRILGLDLAGTDDFLKQVTGEGIHWRDPEEIVWGYAIVQGLRADRAGELLEQVRGLGKKRKAVPAPDSYTENVRKEIEPLLYGSWEALLMYLSGAGNKLGALHNTAHRLFMQYMELLETGGAEDLVGDATQMTSREVLEKYMYRSLVPVVRREDAKEKTAFSAVQRSIRANWPDEAALSKMKSRELDVPRKVLILLFLATDGGETEYAGEYEEDYDEYEEEPLCRDEVFQDVYTRLNRMLKACGFQMQDPRSPFDWMVLYCICVDDLWDVDQRLGDMLQSIFPDGNEKQ